MPIIQEVRCILLSSPYADIEDPEIKECFPNGPKRTIGMVEVTLDNGFKGLGEGYLAVFAPKVFKSIVDLCTPYLINTDAFDLKQRVRDLCRICDYWSLQGAARHVTSAFEIALADAQAKSMGVPVHNLYGEAKENSIRMYGSGGCCDQKEHFIRELEMLEGLGINLYKIRAVKEDIRRTAWILEEAGQRGIEVGVDMCQNLTDPPQKVKDVADYVDSVYKLTDYKILFLEEAIGPANPEGFKSLRETVSPKICGGEIITTPREMIDRISANKTNNIFKPKWQGGDMKVLIPMAGAGSRFEKAGYTFPKPLIEVDSKPMIQVVVDNLNVDAGHVFITQKSHYEDYNLSYLLNLISPSCDIVQVDGITEGAACTTLLAKEHIDNDQPLLIANSDQYVDWDSNEFLYAMQAEGVDAGILTFESVHPKWSFAKVDDTGFVTEVAEKKPISSNATVGIYYWARGSDYVKYAEQMIAKNRRVNNEFYVCPVFNEAIEDGKKIKIFPVENMWGIGTPEDLEIFLGR